MGSDFYETHTSYFENASYHTHTEGVISVLNSENPSLFSKFVCQLKAFGMITCHFFKR